jgi:DNA-binding MarR family transcriptional regulator
MGFDKKYYLSHYSPNGNAMDTSYDCGTHNEMPNIRRSERDRFETMILRCTRNRAKTEIAISKEIKLNLPIVSQLVTDLMMKGLLQRTRNQRMMLFFRKDSFSTTIEGLLALEHIQRNGTNRTFLSQTLGGLKYGSQRMVEEATSNSILLKLLFGTLRLLFRAAKYALIR